MVRKPENFKIKTGYNEISVIYRAGALELRSPDNAIQSVINLKKPYRLALPNLEHLISILLFIHPPKKILVLGTAGGSLLHFLKHHYPESHLTTVDIDSELIEQLLQLNLLPPADGKLSYVYDDAAHFARHTTDQFDLILIDVFDGAQTPTWLTEKAFLEILHSRLKPQGALGFNLLIDSDHEFSRFYRDLRLVCQKQTLCMPVPRFENTIVFGFREQPPQRELSWYLEHTLHMSQIHAIDYMEILSAIYTTNPSGEVIG